MAYWKEHPGLFINFFVSIGDPSEPGSLVDRIAGVDTSNGVKLITDHNLADIEECYLIARSTESMSPEENKRWMNIQRKRVIEDRRANYIQTSQSMLFLLGNRVYPFQDSHFGKENYLIKYNEV